MQQCPRCGASVTPGARFCPSCAFDMSRVAPAQAMQPAACPNCGNRVAAGARFCPVCAAPIGAGGYANQPSYPNAGYNAPAASSSKKPIIIGAIILLVLIGGGIAAYFLLGKSSNQSSVSSSSNSNASAIPAPADSPSRTAEKMVRAIEGEDWDSFRNLAAGELTRDLDEVQRTVPAIRSAGGIDSINIQREDVTGDTATVLYEIKWRNGTTEDYYMRMVKENGVWRVNDMSGIEPPEMPMITPPPVPPPLPDSPNTNTSSTSSQPGSNVNVGSKPPTPTIVRKSGGVLAGEATRRVEPPYPALARAARVEGAVVVELTIDERGNVTSARALSGHPLLKDAAVNAARQWTFRPTVLGGAPVKVIGTITFNFKL